MAEVNAISNVDNKNVNISSGKKSSDISSDFSSFLGESKSLDAIFRQAAEKYNVPVELLKAIGKQESNFNAKAVSRCGAQGIMQLMPATAKELGVTDSFDAEQNIMGGAKYISGLLKKYNGDTKLALAAYNAGSGNVKKYGGIPPFEETQNYVKKVMKYMGQNLDSEISAASSKISTGQGTTNPSNAGNAYHTPTPIAVPVQNNVSMLLSSSILGDDSDIQFLEDLFSYDDYLKFLDLFLEEMDKNEKENDDESKSIYTAKELSYNVPIMNLIKNQNITNI